MHNSLNSTPFAIGADCYAVFDEDTERYTVYTGADPMTADAIGEAVTINEAKQIAREHRDA